MNQGPHVGAWRAPKGLNHWRLQQAPTHCVRLQQSPTQLCPLIWLRQHILWCLQLFWSLSKPSTAAPAGGVAHWYVLALAVLQQQPLLQAPASGEQRADTARQGRACCLTQTLGQKVQAPGPQASGAGWSLGPYSLRGQCHSVPLLTFTWTKAVCLLTDACGHRIERAQIGLDFYQKVHFCTESTLIERALIVQSSNTTPP